MWASGDEKTWKEIWRAASVKDEWLVDLSTAEGAARESARCRFLKIGLPGKGTLHLNKVTVFGE